MSGRLALLQEPEHQLRVRERQRTRASQRRYFCGYVRLAPQFVDNVGNMSNRWFFEERNQWNLDVECFPQSRDDFQRFQRIPAQIKEVRGHLNGVQLQHVSPDLCDRLLRARSGTIGFQSLRDFGEMRYGGLFKKRDERNFDVERRSQAGDDFDCLQRISAQLEEIVTHANRRNAQHLFPHAFHCSLGCVEFLRQFCRLQLVHNSCEMSNRGVFKERDQRKIDSQRGTEPRNDLDGLQRISSEFEEVVAGSHFWFLQHIAPNLRDGRCGRGRHLVTIVASFDCHAGELLAARTESLTGVPSVLSFCRAE